jgi:hypothetical protein
MKQHRDKSEKAPGAAMIKLISRSLVLFGAYTSPLQVRLKE